MDHNDIDPTLFDINSAFELLPLLLGLYTEVNVIEYVRVNLTSQLTNIKDKDLQKTLHLILSQLTRLQHEGGLDQFKSVKVTQIDDNKVLLLSMLFGDIATQALRIIQENNITFVSPQPIDTAIYLRTGKSPSPVLIQVTQATTIIHHGSPLSENQLVEHEIQQCLSQLNLTVSQGKLKPQSQNAAYKTNDSKRTTRTFECDLFNWYCSCDDYHLCYTTSWIPHKPVAYTNPATPKYFEPIKFDSMTPIPICCHLLALLILRHDPIVLQHCIQGIRH